MDDLIVTLAQAVSGWEYTVGEVCDICWPPAALRTCYRGCAVDQAKAYRNHQDIWDIEKDRTPLEIERGAQFQILMSPSLQSVTEMAVNL